MPPSQRQSLRSGEPIRVALDTSFAGVNPTGVGLYSRRLASTMVDNQNEYGVKVKCYGAACGDSHRSPTLRTLSTEWPSYTHIALPAQLVGYRPSVVHSTSHIGPLWGPGKHIVTVHDLIFRRYPSDYAPIWLAITRITLPLVLNRATAIIADSHATKHDLQDFYGVRTGKIVVVYPGVDAQHTATEKRVRARNSPYILCLGPWVRRKNLEVVVKAFDELAPRIPDVRLVITGKPSSGMKGYTEQEILGQLSANTRSRIDLMGYVDRITLSGLVSGASLLAYPSRWEGFGMPPLEAMSAGVPVVASNTPAVAEVTGGAAMLCDPDKTQDWTIAICRVLTDIPFTARLVEKGKRRSAQFSWETCAEQTAMLYHRVAGR